MQPAAVAILAIPGMSLFHLSVPSVVFQDASHHFELIHVSEVPGRLRTNSGVDIHVEQDLTGLSLAGMIIIPTWYDPYQPPSERLVTALREAHRRGAVIVGLCLGAYVVAACGLLDGRVATTHWAYAEDFAARFPGVSLDPMVLYVDHGDVLTSAGTAAAIDCCLHVLRKRHGSREANRVARRLVMPPHRDGGQAQFIETAVPETRRDHRLAGTIEWLLANLDQPHSIASLAERTLMSRRTFTREFQKITGYSLTPWLTKQRLALAQQLLESTRLPVERVSELAGFASPVTFRMHFRNTVGVPPAEWRKRFSQNPA